MLTYSDIDNLFEAQIPQWQLAFDNYDALHNIEVRNIIVNGIEVRIQHNPARITSVSSKPHATVQQSCFLCHDNLPQQQLQLPYNERFTILVNPYPIFDRHFTIPATIHTPQRIAENFDTMLQLARSCTPYTLFYNGPRCGASAPMHLHFQAGNSGYMPIEQQWHKAPNRHITTYGEATLSLVEGVLRPIFCITSTRNNDAEVLFDKLYDAIPPIVGEEPMMNIIMRCDNDTLTTLIFPRAKHRPDCYYASDNNRLLISPGSVEMGGVFITPRKEDFEKITAQDIINIYNEVALSDEKVQNIISTIK